MKRLFKRVTDGIKKAATKFRTIIALLQLLIVNHREEFIQAIEYKIEHKMANSLFVSYQVVNTKTALL